MLKKILISLLAIMVLSTQGMGAVVYAAPELPQSPEKPKLPDNAPIPSPDPSSSPTVTPSATPPPTPQPSPTASPTPDPTPTPTPSPEPIAKSNGPEKPSSPSLPGTSGQGTGGQSSDNTTGGNAEVKTGNATTTGTALTTGNNNLSTGARENSGIGGPPVKITNEGNGTGSENTGSAEISNSKETEQGNSATVDNVLALESDSGRNSSSRNTGGTSTIETGDANVTGTIVNSVNTNVDGVVVSEFNVVDDNVGDIVLDFGSGCSLGCGGGEIFLKNKENGADSENTTDASISNSNVTTQTNEAFLSNDLVLIANSGENDASRNTGGDSSVKTGDANASGSILNFANNNFAGNVVYGVVNIFGNLVGDIIIPENYREQLASIGIANTQNGSGSKNSGTVDIVGIDEFTQFNSAEIINNLDLDANTGGNEVSRNTGGNNKIKTGNSSVDAQVLNVANTNLIGQDMWIILVNEAGNWLGKIIGPEGNVIDSFFAASAGVSAQEGEGGAISVTNGDNGSGSTNTGSVKIEDENKITQTNNAVIENNVAMSANTGRNTATKNTGGGSEIETGDANIILNVVNFVNNNIIGGNVLVTVFNVFGSFTGDILSPGAQKKPVEEPVALSQARDDGKTDLSLDSESPAIGGLNLDIKEESPVGSSGTQSHAVEVESKTATSEAGTRIASIKSSDKPVNSEIAAEILGTTAKEEGAINRKIRLNLAWAVLVLPAYLIFTLAKKTGIAGLLLARVRG